MRYTSFFLFLSFFLLFACISTDSSSIKSTSKLNEVANSSLILFVQWGKNIDDKFTCYGDSLSPSISIHNIPKNAKTLSFIIYDPDAPSKYFVHWFVVNIPVPSNLTNLTINSYTVNKGQQLKNSFGFVGYGAPCPPINEKHRYVVEVYAMKDKVKINGNIKKMINNIKSKSIASSTFVSYYKR